MMFVGLSEHYHFSMDTPVAELPRKILDIILYGSKGVRIPIRFTSINGEGTYKITYEGIIPTLMRRYQETTSDTAKAMYEQFMREDPCPACQGKRLKPEALAVTVGGMNLSDLSDMTLTDGRAFLSSLALSDTHRRIAQQILNEINVRMALLCDVGRDYQAFPGQPPPCQAAKPSASAWPPRLAPAWWGCFHSGRALHRPAPAGQQPAAEHPEKPRDLGNTLIVVEHDEDTLRAADYLVDIGPGAGEMGGQVVAQGSVQDLMDAPQSVTGDYLAGRKHIPIPKKRREAAGWLTVKGARAHNLKGIDVSFPLGVFCCVSGVSGSGKSSLVNEILYNALARDLNRASTYPGLHDSIAGAEALDKIINIDQSPIGRTPRSNPATYTGLFDLIRATFAQTNEAKARGYNNGRFSFNVKGGRCEACKGDGLLKIEMHFLADIFVPCEVCKGKRYNHETLQVKYRGKTIADVLDMTVEEALRFFEHHVKIKQKLKTLHEVGLGYVRLGQPSTTLSGGEAQRVKLARELARRATGKTLYILDEPTVGLHMADVKRLLQVLSRLVDAGNTVVIIEHNPDIIKVADHIIDLGPEGGDKGGRIVAQGRPEEITKVKASYTGQYLKLAGIK